MVEFTACCGFKSHFSFPLLLFHTVALLSIEGRLSLARCEKTLIKLNLQFHFCLGVKMKSSNIHHLTTFDPDKNQKFLNNATSFSISTIAHFFE